MPDPKQVDRVRALLAKADSTPYPPEQGAFRSKAEELMDRHGLTMADVNEAPPRQPDFVITFVNWTNATTNMQGQAFKVFFDIR